MASYDVKELTKNAPTGYGWKQLREDQKKNAGRGGMDVLPDKYKMGPKKDQRDQGGGIGQGAQEGLQSPDQSGMGVVGDNDSQEVRLGTGFDTEPGRGTNTPMNQAEVDQLAGRAQANIAKVKEWNSVANQGPDTPKLGAFDASGSPLQSGGGTFSVVGKQEGTNSIVERAKAFSEARRKRSPLRRQESSTPSPFAQRKADKERQSRYNDILDNAGSGPNKDISLRHALGAISEMEGQRLGAETARRGQDITADTALNRMDNTREIAANRDRVNMRLGEMDAQDSQARLDQSARLSEAKMAQQQDQFATGQKFKESELEATKLGRATAAATSLKTANLANRRAAMNTRASLLGKATQEDAIGEKELDLDLLYKFYDEMNLSDEF